MSHADTDSNKDASEFSEDDSDTLLEGVGFPTRESKDGLLDTIANDLIVEEETESNKLSKAWFSPIHKHKSTYADVVRC